jgi:hypothetical protein
VDLRERSHQPWIAVKNDDPIAARPTDKLW